METTYCCPTCVTTSCLTLENLAMLVSMKQGTVPSEKRTAATLKSTCEGACTLKAHDGALFFDEIIRHPELQGIHAEGCSNHRHEKLQIGASAEPCRMQGQFCIRSMSRTSYGVAIRSQPRDGASIKRARARRSV